jgi:hypothetical protein
MRPYSESDRSSEDPYLMSRSTFVKLLMSAAAATSLALVVHPREAVAVAHPRLMLTASDVTRLKNSTDAQIVSDKNRLMALADSYVNAPFPSDSFFNLEASRQFLERMFTLGMAWQLNGKSSHGTRIKNELLDMANNVPKWDVQSWLQMGESATGMAIGYDWGYSALSAANCTAIQTAMKREIFDVYLARPDSGNYRYNWNFVTNGGIGMAAMAVQGDASYSSVLSQTLAKVDRWLGEGGFKNFDRPGFEDNIINPSGGYKEGVQYWGTAMRFATYFLASWLTCNGTHNHYFNETPGLRNTVGFYFDSVGPKDRFFEFSDIDYTKTDRHFTHLAGWYARQYNDPTYRYIHNDGWRIRPSSGVDGQDAALSMLWKGGAGSLATRPLDSHYPGTEVLTLRSGYDERAIYVASRVGGDVDRGHTHLDRGSFVLHANGVEFFEDLGHDTYSLPDYDNYYNPTPEYALRWRYYRLRAEGHNTLVINPDANPDQRAGKEESNFIPTVEKESLNTASPFVVTNLTPIYSGRAPWNSILSVKRGLKMENRSSVIVQDEIRASSGATVWWFAHAETKKSGASMTLSADGTEATLVKDSSGMRLWCKLLSPAGVRFAVKPARRLSTSPPGYADEDSNATYEKLAIQLTNATAATIAVYIKPLKPGEAPPRTALPGMRSLANW